MLVDHRSSSPYSCITNQNIYEDIVKKIVNFTALAIIASLFLFVLYWNSKIMPAIFPSMQVIYETSMEPVDIYIGDVHYSVPKAYLYWPADMDGGKLKDFSMRANIDENMVPWTTSQNYKNRIKEGMTYVDILNGYSESATQDEINRMRKSYKKMFPDRYQDMEYGIYKDVFKRYDQLSVITNTNKEGKGSIFYLIPQIETTHNFNISCPIHGNPEHVLCTVGTFKNHTSYKFKMPLKAIETFQEVNHKVWNFIEKLIVKE